MTPARRPSPLSPQHALLAPCSTLPFLAWLQRQSPLPALRRACQRQMPPRPILRCWLHRRAARRRWHRAEVLRTAPQQPWLLQRLRQPSSLPRPLRGLQQLCSCRRLLCSHLQLHRLALWAMQQVPLRSLALSTLEGAGSMPASGKLARRSGLSRVTTFLSGRRCLMSSLTAH